MRKADLSLFIALSMAFLDPSGAVAAPLEIAVVPTVDGVPLRSGEGSFLNRSGERWTATRVSYLLSEPALRDREGPWVSWAADPAWLSLSDGRISWSLPGAPEGEWTELRFSVGLPPALDEADPAQWPPGHPLNPNLNGLHWSWQGGYLFLAFEGRFWPQATESSAASGFSFHLAREPYRSEVVVPLELRLAEGDATAGNATRVALEFDLGRVLDGEKSLSFLRDGRSTHSKDGDPVAAALRSNLAAAFRPVPSVGGAKGVVADAPSSGAGVRESAPGGLPIPATFPKPSLPPGASFSAERVALGRRLFRETALSRSGTLSCASCHLASAALSDPRPVSAGEQGRLGHRNGMPLFNLAWKPSFFWDGRAEWLRDQVLVPIEDHRELDERVDRVVAKLRGKADYEKEFAAAFGEAGISSERLALALESFLLTLVSHDSKFDRARSGTDRLTALEERGFELFMTEREPRSGQFGGDCFHCHGGALFTDHQFRNNGLPVDPADPGRAAVTGSPLDRGTFATPSLRNIALTAPYMHDGRFATLEEVLDHYSEGVQRTETLDPNLAKHPEGGLGLSAEEKSAIIAFLRTLTDDRFARSADAGSDTLPPVRASREGGL